MAILEQASYRPAKPIHSNPMLKLYKWTTTGLHDWETWEETNQTAIVHWDLVGERGHDQEVKPKTSSGFRQQIQRIGGLAFRVMRPRKGKAI